ncbi:MAG: LysR family transcriptional regulator [Rubrivivax sp.]|nr:LysR family transcriptional regulator [Rubrivivax sp.]
MALNFRSLDLNLLRVFDAVMAEGSLTRAADTLAMTQPAVSHAMRRLREAVGEELFTRSAHGMRPTPRAEQLWPRVRETLSHLREALAPERFDARTEAVHFRLAMADATAALLSPGLLSLIESDQLAVSLRMLPLITRDPRRLLEAGEADLAVGYFPEVMTTLAALGRDSPLRHERLYQSRYVCVMRRGHPLAEAPLSIDTYCAAHHLLVSFSGRPYGYVDQALELRGRRRRIVLTVNQFFTAGRVVTQSDLLTVLPEGFVEATGYREELVTRDLPFEMQPVHVDMLWHRRHDMHPAQRWLREQVHAAVKAAESSV